RSACPERTSETSASSSTSDMGGRHSFAESVAETADEQQSARSVRGASASLPAAPTPRRTEVPKMSAEGAVDSDIMTLENLGDLPPAARLAAWATTWLGDNADLSDVVDKVRGDDEPHTVVELPDLSGEVQLGTALESLRTDDATAFTVAL